MTKGEKTVLPLPPSPSPDRLALIIPCYNESARWRFRPLWEFAMGATYPLMLIMVDDGSTDDTRNRLQESAEALNARWSHQPDGSLCDVLVLPHNQGKAEAVRRGLLHALEFADSLEFAGYWDADWSVPLDDVNRFRTVLQADPTCQWVFGSRASFARSPLRALTGAVFSWFALRALKESIPDTQCGAKLFRATPVLRELLALPFQSRWVFDVELLVRYRRWLQNHEKRSNTPSTGFLNTLVRSEPVSRWTDCPGSKLRWHDYPRAIRDLYRITRG